MKKQFFLIWLVIFLLIFPQACAYISKFVSKNEAEALVSIENHYLKPGETASADEIIVLGKNQYWIVTIKTGETPIGYIAVKDAKEAEIVSKTADNRKLFRAAYLLWAFRNVENSFKKQNNWFFTLTNAGSLRNLAQLLENEKISLNIIKTETADFEINRKANTLNSKLDLLAAKATALSDNLTLTINFEKEFLTNPSVERLTQFEAFFQLSETEADSLLYQLNDLIEEATDYTTKEVTELKNLIAKSDLDADTKTRLISVASVPFSLSDLQSLGSTLAANKQGLDEIFLGLDAQVDSFLSGFAVRQAMNEAYQKIYGEDEGIVDVTKGQVSTLSEAAYDILETEKKDYWAAQSNVASLEREWSAVKKNFEKGDFAGALVAAQEAIDDAKRIYRQGIKEIEVEEVDLMPLIQTVAIALIVLLAIIIILKNRERIAGFFAREEMEEERGVELSEFKKKW